MLGLAVCVAIPTLALHAPQAAAGESLEERKLPMKFAWNACAPDCAGWVSAVGIVTSDTPALFEDFARGRDLVGASIVLDSSGGSVNDALTLGRRWRGLKVTTSVGTTISQAGRPSIAPEAYCESMCVFLVLAGQTRYVPEAAKVRVHQIWMGDRADNARAATYSAQDMMIVERDIGRLAKYTFDMGGTGDLLALALSVPPWEELHRLTLAEQRATNLLTTEIRPAGFPPEQRAPEMAKLSPKATQERIVAEVAHEVEARTDERAARPTKTAEAQSSGGLTQQGR